MNSVFTEKKVKIRSRLDDSLDVSSTQTVGLPPENNRKTPFLFNEEESIPHLHSTLISPKNADGFEKKRSIKYNQLSGQNILDTMNNAGASSPKIVPTHRGSNTNFIVLNSNMVHQLPQLTNGGKRNVISNSAAVETKV